MSKSAFSTIDSSDLADVCGGSWWSIDYPGKSDGSGGGGGGAGDEPHGPPTEIERSVKVGFHGLDFELKRHDKYAPPKS